MKKIKKILVTGSSGMIGTALCEELVQSGYEPVGADLVHNKWSESVDSPTLICDLRDRSFFDLLPKDFDMVIHLAANARVFNTVVRPVLARDNLEMVFNVLEFCRLNNIRRAMLASSREVYGNTAELPASEGEVSLPEDSESPYAATKIGAEALASAYRRCYGIGCLVLRLSNVYGRYDDSDRVVPLFIERALKGEDLVVFGEGKLLDFTYISDCIDGIMSSIQRFDQVEGSVFNIASGKGTTLVEFARIIQDKTGAEGKIIVRESRAGEVEQYIANISRAKELLRYEPKVSINEGIEKTIQWYRSIGGSSRG